MFRSTLPAFLAVVLASTSAVAMCGGGTGQQGVTTSEPSAKTQCMPMKSGGSDAIKGDKKSGDDADAHAGMNMPSEGKDGPMDMGGCGCCKDMMKSGGGKSGMCGGKQASLLLENGSNDPLLNDPMWPQSKVQGAPGSN